MAKVAKKTSRQAKPDVAFFSIKLSSAKNKATIAITVSSISNWETGRTYPDVQSLLLLSVAFDISIDELIKGDVETMEESVRKADHSLIWMYAAEMLLTVISDFCPLCFLSLFVLFHFFR